MKNILKAKPLSPSYIKKIDRYFQSKSKLFDTFDEIFLHIGFIIDKSNRSPSDLVELAIEDIVFDTQEDLQKHVSEYFYFHNSVVRFLDFLQTAVDSDEVVKKTKKIAKALFELCNQDVDDFQQRVAEEAIELVEIIMQNHGLTVDINSDNIEDIFYSKLSNASAASTLATVIYAIPYLQNREYGKKDSIAITSTLLLLCMIFNYLKKDNSIKK